MSEYTPTMANVRTSFAEAWAAEVMSDDAVWIQDYEQGLAAFDRAIAAHDRTVKAEAWDEGKDAVWLDENEHRFFLSYDPNPYRADQINPTPNGTP